MRGSGVVRGSGTDSASVRLGLGEGQIIGDGFGEESALDLNSVVSVSNIFAEVASDTTNGWYALNKGAVLYPRTYKAQGGKTITSIVGGRNGDAAPRFVNSVGVSVTREWESECFLRGGFFASDRNDIHVEMLAGGGDVVGVWKFGITGKVDDDTVYSYVSADLDFRYDQTKVNVGDNLALYRWNGSSWTRVAKKRADSSYKISVSGLGPLASGSHDGIYNIGTFAVVRKDFKGLVITVL